MDAHSDEVRRARWRCVIRNKAFRREMREVGQAFLDGASDRTRRLDAFHERWGFQYVHVEWIETFALSDVDDEVDFLEPLASAAYYWPVLPHYTDEGDRFVTMTVDVSCPLADLTPAFEREVREFAAAWNDSPRGRQRLDKLDFQLSVYDRFVATRSFRLVGKELDKPATTIRSAFWSALRAIGEVVPQRTKRSFQLNEIGDPEQHRKLCPTCRGGDTLCAAALAWVDQDAVSQRELTVGLEPLGTTPTAKRKRTAKVV